MAKKVKKLIGIAPAPDFTTDLILKELTKIEKKRLKMNDIVEKKVNKDFSYKYSPKLFLNSKKHLIKNINIFILPLIIFIISYLLMFYKLRLKFKL